MKNKLFYFILIVLLQLNCKRAEHSENQPTNITQDTIVTKKDLSCDDLVMKLVKSSNLDLTDYNDNFFVRIDKIQNDTINIHIYVENNLSDDSKQKQIVESTIAFLIFLPNEKKLLDITADPDNPTEVKFKYNDFDAFYKLCGIEKKSNNKAYPVTSLSNEDCKDITIEMGAGKECIIKNTDIQTVYKNLIKNEEVEDVKYYLSNLPSKNQIININKNGLINIEYNIAKDKIKIIMSYEGGVTEVSIEKLNNNVKRSIYYYAD